MELWWQILNRFHKLPQTGSWYIAADPKQLIHTPSAADPQMLLTHFPKDLGIWPLRWNFRNSPSIYRALNKAGTWQDMQTALEDHEDEYLKKGVHEINHKDLHGALTKCVKTMKQYGMDASDIVVISCRRFEHGLIHKKQNGTLPTYAGFTIDGSEVSSETNIAYFTIHRFKGLEAQVVILCDFSDKHNEDLYRIALSRARLMVFEVT